VLSFENFLEPANGTVHRHAVKTCATLNVAQKTLDLARAKHGHLVFGRQFIHAQDCNDVLRSL
jgi:hypothetical protein